MAAATVKCRIVYLHLGRNALKMPFKMYITLKNWKLAILALIFLCLFVSLGCWQLWRAQEKKILMKSFSERTLHEPFSAAAITKENDLRFYRIKLTGFFDNQHSLLLDNKIFHGKVGYEVYTPFYCKDLADPILVDRGFIPGSVSRRDLPGINAIIGTVTITGMLNLPPRYVALGRINETQEINWPLRIEFVNLMEVAKLLNYPLYHYVLNLEAKDPAAYAIEWQIVTMGPEKHIGYAIQWFALALTLLILFVVLNRNTSERK